MMNGPRTPISAESAKIEDDPPSPFLSKRCMDSVTGLAAAMSVGRKIFIVLSSFIIGFSTVFVLLTYVVIRDSMDAMLQTSREEELDQLQGRLLGYYVKNGHTFRAVQDQAWLADSLRSADRLESILLTSGNKDPLA